MSDYVPKTFVPTNCVYRYLWHFCLGVFDPESKLKLVFCSSLKSCLCTRHLYAPPPWGGGIPWLKCRDLTYDVSHSAVDVWGF